MTQMTTEEAFVKTLQAHGIRHAFGIIGSAMMPISDIFPKAGITEPARLFHRNSGETLGKGPGEKSPAGFANLAVIPVDPDPIKPAAGRLAFEDKTAEVFLL